MSYISKILANSLALLILSACYSVDTNSFFNDILSRAESNSRPIYLSFRDTKNAPFYFLLNKESEDEFYKLIVRWKNPNKSILLFDGERSLLTFMVDREFIYKFSPSALTKVVSYDVNAGSIEEEGVFEIPKDIFRKIVYARYVSVELQGKIKSVIGEFNRMNTQRAFKDFYNNSY